MLNYLKLLEFLSLKSIEGFFFIFCFNFATLLLLFIDFSSQLHYRIHKECCSVNFEILVVIIVV